MERGDIVVPIDPIRDVLHCGSGCYPHAICVSAEPFVLVSESSDMRWSCLEKDKYMAQGKATPEMLKRCDRRLKS